MKPEKPQTDLHPKLVVQHQKVLEQKKVVQKVKGLQRQDWG